jgi:alkanesulfonate monooxygenase SsuD/methylene tetrahydromethanopterin reductase-like flavin-dependent oxidoreductase (luciferase family)
MKKQIAELVKLYTQEQSLGEQIKAVKEEVKAAGGNPAIVAAVAKAIVADKVEELKEKSEVTVEMIELSRD